MGRKEPLLRFGVFEQVHVPPAPAFKGDYHLAAFKPEWDFQTYKQAFDIMRGFLQSGDIYQAKLTFPMAAAYKGCLVRLYERLFDHENPDVAEDGFLSVLNADSLSLVEGAKLEPGLAGEERGFVCQFERLGYFCADSRYHQPGVKAVYNRTIGLKDSWAKKKG